MNLTEPENISIRVQLVSDFKIDANILDLKWQLTDFTHEVYLSWGVVIGLWKQMFNVFCVSLSSFRK